MGAQMNLESLELFLAVAAAGSFKGASERLDVSRATLRRKLDELEESAGITLMTRSREGVSLTAAGELLAKRAQEMLGDSEALFTSLKDFAETPHGQLRVLVPLGLPPQIQGMVLHYFCQRYPKVRVKISFSDSPVEHLGDDVDVALAFGEELPRGAWLCRKIVQVEEMVLASPEYLRRHGSPRGVEELSSHTLLSWERTLGGPRRWPLRGGGTVEVDPVLVASDMHVIHSAIDAQLGLGLVLHYEPFEGWPGGLRPVQVLADEVGASWSARLFWPEARAHLPKIRAFLNTLDEVKHFAPGMA
jgi:DNA-binding transcriptional LysR family regulator